MEFPIRSSFSSNLAKVLQELLSEHKIILGSQSPRRRNLLKGLDIDFESCTIDADESFDPNMDYHEVPEYLANKKSHDFGKELSKNEILITADTVVILKDMILNKPQNRAEAIDMLTLLSGEEHKVVTGVCIRSSDKTRLFQDQTRVRFHKLTTEEICYYIDRYQPFDKAGSYGIQEWIGYVAIKEMIGCFYNVMGLPLPKLYPELKNFIND